jgi:hypothetical protein
LKNKTSPSVGEAPTSAAFSVVSTPIEKPEDRFRWLLIVGKDKAISANATRVALLLTLQYFSRRKMLAFPSQEKLSADTDLGVSTIRRAIKDLMNAGYLNSYKAFGSSNRYIFCLPIRSELSGLEDRGREDPNPLNIERSIRSESSGQSARNRAPNHMNEPYEGALAARPPESHSASNYETYDHDDENMVCSGAPDARLTSTLSPSSHAPPSPTYEDEGTPSWEAIFDQLESEGVFDDVVSDSDDVPF